MIAADEVWSGTIHVAGNLTIPAGVTVTIDPGTVIKIDTGQWIVVAGTLEAVGGEGNPIVFTSYRDDAFGENVSGPADEVPVVGDWEAIYFDPGSDASVLEWVEIRYGGRDHSPVSGAALPQVHLRGAAAPALRDTVIGPAFQNGLEVQGSGTPILERVQVEGVGGSAFVFSLASEPAATALSAAGNGFDRIMREGGNLTGARTWGDEGGLPIHLTTQLTVEAGSSLTLVPGTVLKFPDGAYFLADGTLTAVGTAAQPIVLTADDDDSVGGDSNGNADSTAPQPGSWDRFILRGAGASASVIEHLEVRYNGRDHSPASGAFFPAVTIENS